MTEYIEREAAIDAIMKVYVRTAGYKARERVFEAEEAVHRLPVADVAPVVYGKWECVYDGSTGKTDITCSHCKTTRTVNGCFVSTDGESCYFEDDYCPACGARMGGDSDAE